MRSTMDLQITGCPRCGATHAYPSCPRCGCSAIEGGVGHTTHAQAAERPACRMNKTEARYAQRLAGYVAAAQISGYRFEAVKFRLADATFYTPDFMVIYPGGSIEFHEVKGARIWDDAAVKFKVAAEAFPMFGWRLVQWKRGEWLTLRGYVNGYPK